MCGTEKDLLAKKIQSFENAKYLYYSHAGYFWKLLEHFQQIFFVKFSNIN